jgi:hypothetical protein
MKHSIKLWEPLMQDKIEKETGGDVRVDIQTSYLPITN